MKNLKVGILGCGRISKVHIANIQTKIPQMQIVGVYDPVVDKEWAAQHKLVVYKSESELINSGIEAVIICSQSAMHAEQISKAANLGLHIFCEKPIGLNITEIENSLHLVEKSQVVLQVGFNRRFDPSFNYLQKRISLGDIGSPQIIKITSRDPACPSESYVATSGGIFLDMSIHDLDMARFLAGCEVTEIYAQGACLISPFFAKYNDYDTAIIQLKFENGCLAVIDNSRQASYGYDQRIEVFGNKGCLSANNVFQNNVETFTSEGLRKPPLQHFFLDRYKDAFIFEMESFYNSVISESRSAVTGYDGLQAIRLAFAAQKSAKTNQPVSLV